MARTLDHIVDDAEFEKSHKHQLTSLKQKDVFFIWLVVVLIAIFAAHMVLNVSGSATGYVTAAEDPVENTTMLLYTLFAVFVVVFITALIHIGITQKDR